MLRNFKIKNAKSLTSRGTRAPWIPKYLYNGGGRRGRGVKSAVYILFVLVFHYLGSWFKKKKKPKIKPKRETLFESSNYLFSAFRREASKPQSVALIRG